MTPTPWPAGIEDTEITAPGDAPIIGAACNVCRTLFLTADPARAVAWSLEHAHNGNMFIVELVVLAGSPGAARGNGQQPRTR